MPIRRFNIRFLFAALLCCLAAVTSVAALAADPFAKTPTVATPGIAASQDEFLPVEKAYQMEPAFFDDRLVLHWQIADGYYLYRHQFAFRDEAGKTLDATLPAGKVKDDEYFGRVEVYYGEVDATLTGLPAEPFTLAITSQGCADAGLCYPPRTEYLRIDPAKHSAEHIAPPARPAATAAAPPASGSWWAMLALALAGGAILNLMPCVFPVLSLKALRFAGDSRHRAAHGLAYTAGVVMSFLLVAAVLLALRAAGQAIGWGFQLQQPWFVAALAYLFFAMGLSLSGFWAVGGAWMGAGGRLAGGSGYAGSFFTGVLATVVASPCTAPFMGTALGFAISQPAPAALGIFAALGLGMALPMLALSLSPRLVALMPRPGAWMERFKHALAFPLYGTAIWLAWIVGRQTGASGMAAVLAGALALTLALWLWRFSLFSRSLAAASLAVAVGLLGSPLLEKGRAEAAPESAENWQPYRADTLSALRAAGKPVFLNVTADWCITCLANERVALSSAPVQQVFAEHGVTYLKGDWTRYDAAITQLLAGFGRSGVPLYVFYPANGGAPVILPQLLTPGLVTAAVGGQS